MNEELAENLFNASVRVEQMFWIPGITAQPPREFEDFLSDEIAGDCAPAVLEALPFLKGMIDEGAEAEDVVAEMNFRRKIGFIAQVATPRPYDIRKDGSHSFTWGHYHTKWLYADTLESLSEQAVTWAEGVLETAKAEADA